MQAVIGSGDSVSRKTSRFLAGHASDSRFTTRDSRSFAFSDRDAKNPCDNATRNDRKTPVHPLHLPYSYATVSVLLREAEVCSFPMRLRSEGDDRLLA